VAGYGIVRRAIVAGDQDSAIVMTKLVERTSGVGDRLGGDRGDLDVAEESIIAPSTPRFEDDPQAFGRTCQ